MHTVTRRLSGRYRPTALAVTCVVLALLTTTLIKVHSGNGSTSSPPGSSVDDASAPAVPPMPPDETLESEAQPSTIRASNEDGYAAAVSALVFAMDTRASTPAELRQQLRQEADPALSDAGLDDLYDTIDARVPADALWERMRANSQWSQWQPTRKWEPATWAQVVTQGHAEPGWVMRNVTGVQTTNYVEDGLSRSTSREATLTVVMRCPAEGVNLPRCHLVLISTQPVF